MDLREHDQLVITKKRAATVVGDDDDTGISAPLRPFQAVAKVVASRKYSPIVAPTASTSSSTRSKNGPDFKDQMRTADGLPIRKSTSNNSPDCVPDKWKAKRKMFAPTNAAVRGPAFKDQSRPVDDPVPQREWIPNRPLSPPESTDPAENDPAIVARSNSTAMDDRSTATDSNRVGENENSSSRGAPHLVEAELVHNINNYNDPIGVAAEVMAEKPQRRGWMVVLGMVLVLIIIGGIVSGVKEADSNESDRGPSMQSLASLKNASGCYNATGLELDDTPMNIYFDDRNTSARLVDFAIVPTCGSAEGLSDDLVGIWFTFETNMTRGVRIAICTEEQEDDDSNGKFQMQMLVFTGPCEKLRCLQGKRNKGLVEGCSAEVGESFQAFRSTVYYILVYGRTARNTVTKFAVQAVTTQVDPSNNECGAATTLQNGQWLNSSVLDADFPNGYSCCGQACDYITESAPSVWFLFDSRGGAVSFSTCSPTTSFGHNLIVYTGSCNNLLPECDLDASITYSVDDKSLNCSGIANTIHIFTELPVSFRIMVQSVSHRLSAQTPNPGRNLTNPVAGDGHEDFAISARYVTIESPVNEYCGGAAALEANEIVVSTTRGASPDTRQTCNVFNHSDSVTQGVWFQFIGDNTRYTATTCTGAEGVTTYGQDFDSQINVFSGDDCQNLACIAYNEENNEKLPCNNGASWLAESGVRYWIRVFSFSSTGSFPFAVHPTPSNSVCEAATFLEVGQAAVEGTTCGSLAGPRNAGICGDVFSAEELSSVWYSVIGVDEELTVTTCAGFSQQQVLVYNGTCSHLVCIDGNSYNSDVATQCSGYTATSWFANAGTVYYIRVMSAWEIRADSFDIEVVIGRPPTAFTPPANDFCENASLLGDVTAVLGSTVYATPSDIPLDELAVCDGESSSNFNLHRDVWYQFTGTGEWHTATTCTGFSASDGTGFDSYINIYSGTCNNLTCVVSNDDFFSSNCPQTNAVASWLTEEGQTYLVRVSGARELYMGEFGIRIDQGKTEPLPYPENDNCENATLLELDQIVESTMRGATGRSGLQVCGQPNEPEKPNIPDVWYSIVGTGDVLTISTCTGTDLDDSYVDSYIIVYTGTCPLELTCIAGNDYSERDLCGEDANLSSVSWQSELSVTYFVRIYLSSGFESEESFGVWAYAGTPDGQPLPEETSQPTTATFAPSII